MTVTDATSNQRRRTEPRASLPYMPDGYLNHKGEHILLPWQHARERLEMARNYWVGTVYPDGRPHSRPIWGAWVDDTFFFDGSPDTRRGRNLAANSNATVHLESGDDVVIVEGQARMLEKPPHSLTERVAEAYRAKYAPGYAPTADQWDNGGLYALTPRVAFAWTKFPDTCTRWHFEPIEEVLD